MANADVSDFKNCFDSHFSAEERRLLNEYHADDLNWRKNGCYFNGADIRICVPHRNKKQCGWACNAHYFCPATCCDDVDPLSDPLCHVGSKQPLLSAGEKELAPTCQPPVFQAMEGR